MFETRRIVIKRKGPQGYNWKSQVITIPREPWYTGGDEVREQEERESY